MKTNETNLLPILIIPGFMSSGLEIKKSNLNKNWQGKRIWLNLTSLGFESFTKIGTVNYTQENKHKHHHRDDYYKELNEDTEKQQQIECVNQWLKHMCLSADMCTEHDGIEVRAIEGLEGVDYLTPGALTNHLSYVFGPVIKALQNVGYTNQNLDAAPYDWRLSPVTLEKRDGYFRNVTKKVERLYNDNGGLRVVLLCHSLGCKTGHYFLNWVKNTIGQKWIDMYIHTYIPVGSPHLGAPKSIRATVNGDKMGLDAFLSDEEGLVLGRSLGSGPWLMPSHLPHSSPPTAYLRKDGVITVTLGGMIDFTPFFKTKNPTKLRIAIFYGKDMLCTTFKSPSNACSYNFNDTFVFAIPFSSKPSLDSIKIVLHEPGLGLSRQLSKTGPYYSWYCCPLRSSVTVLMCPIKYICCCPCLYLYRTVNGVLQAGAKGTDVAGGKLGGSTILASSSKIPLSKIFSHATGNEIIKDHVITLEHVNNSKGIMFRSFFRKQTFVKINARINWQREPCVSITPQNDNDIAIAIPSSNNNNNSLSIKPYHPNDVQISYDPLSGNALLKNEGLLSQIQNHLLQNYENDPIGPRTLSAINAPPVKNVKAIYGINIPTEVGAVYKRANVIQGKKVQKLHDIDTNAKLKNNFYKISNGIILETPQGNGYTSGDGTVPYWSLSHCRTWSKECNVKVHELDRAEHREILADGRFHNILIDYVKNNIN